MESTWTSQFLRSRPMLMFRRWLVEPSAAIREPGQRRRARLLSIFILCLFALFLGINIAYALTVEGYQWPPADLIGYALLTIIYVLSRTRGTLLAVAIMVTMFPLNVLLNVIEGTSLNVAATLSFLIPSYVLASIFLSPLGTAAYGFGVNALVLLLPVIAPDQVPGIAQVLGPAAAGVVAVSLTIIGMLNRDEIERDRATDLRSAYDSTLAGWSRALEIRDKETEGHSRRVAELAMQLAAACGLRGAQLEAVYRGALLHDIGKMALPDSIISKPGALTESERKQMQTHPKVAADLLSSIAFLRPALDIPTYHHEWWNGKGYPNGLKGDQIPLVARVFAVVDAWDALLSDRPYRNAWSREQAIEHLKNQSGVQFDPVMVKRFLELGVAALE